jgi:hypothetical protein
MGDEVDGKVDGEVTQQFDAKLWVCQYGPE